MLGRGVARLDGRGLLIVDQLAEGWGSNEVGTGNKTVWFTLS